MAAATALVKLLGDVDGFSKSLTKAQRDLNRFGQSMTVAGARATASLTIPIIAAGVAILKVGSDFETAMAKVKKTTGAGEEEIAKLGATMRKLSKETIFSASQLAEFTRLGAQLGIGTGKDLQKNTRDLEAFTVAISDLAVAANELPAEEAAKGVAKLINVVGEDISKDVSRVTNTIALLGDTLPTTESRILNFAVQLAGLAKTANLGTAELLGIAGGLSSVTNGTERAASAFQKFTAEFVGAIKGGGPKLEEFARIIDRTPKAIQEAFASGEGDELFVEFAEGLRRVAGQGENLFATLKDLGFGNIKVMQTLLAAAGGADTLRKSVFNATEDVRRFTKAQDEVKVIMNTVEAQMTVLGNTFKDVLIELFIQFEPQIRAVIAALISFAETLLSTVKLFSSVSSNMKFVILAFLGLTAVIGPFLFIVGGLITTGVALGNTFSTITATILNFTKATKSAAIAQTALNIAQSAGVRGRGGSIAAATLPGLGKVTQKRGAGGRLLKKTSGLAAGKSLAGGVGAGGAVAGTNIAKIAGFGSTAVKTSKAATALAASVIGLKIAFAALAGIAIGQVFNKITNNANDTNDAIAKATEGVGIFRGGLSLIGPIFEENFSRAGKFFSSVSKGISSFVSGGVTGIKNFSSSISEAFKSAAEGSGAFGAIAKGTVATMEVFSSVGQGVAIGLGNLVGFVDTLSNSFFGVAEKAEVAGKAINTVFESAEAAREAAAGLSISQFAGQALFAGLDESTLAELMTFIELQRRAEKEVKALSKAEEEAAKRLAVTTAETERQNKAVQGLIKSLGKSGLQQKLKDTVKAFKKLTKGGKDLSKLSKTGLKSIQELIKTLVENGEEVPDALKPIQDEMDKLVEKLFDAERGAILLKAAIEGIPGADFRADVAGARARLGGGTGNQTAEQRKISAELRKTEAQSFKDAQAKLNKSNLDRFGRDELGRIKTGEIEAFDPSTVNQGMQSLDQALRGVEKSLRKFGFAADSAIGLLATAGISLIGILQQAGGAFGLGDFRGFGGGFLDKEREGGRDFTKAAGAGLEGALAIGAATRSGSTGARAGKGALAGAQSGGKIAGPIGAAVGAAVGAVVGWIRGRRAAGRLKEIQDAIGFKVSEALREGIEQAAKDLDIDLKLAALTKLADAIVEAGGVTEDNLRSTSAAFNKLLQAVAAGTIPAKEGMEAISDAFVEIAAGLEAMGIKGQLEIGKMINEMKEMGLVTEEVKQLLTELAQGVIDNFTPMLDLLEKQFGEDGIFAEGAKGIEAAEINLGVLVATFAAAVQAAGGLGGAFALLPESFGALLERFRELIGTENEALNALTAYFNFAKNNSEVLSAIDGLIAGMGQLAEMGILNAQNIGAFTASALLQMNQLLATTNNQTLALQAMGPQIGQLLEFYKQLGLEVPPELQAIADKALEAGANLEPPEGIADILADIRDIMLEVAKAFGIAATEADNFNRSAGSGGGDVPGGRGGDGGGDRDTEFKHGGIVTSPTRALIGEAGPEAVIPLRKFDDVVGGRGDVNITLQPQISVQTLATDEAELAVALTPILNEMISGGRITTELVRRLEGTFQK